MYKLTDDIKALKYIDDKYSQLLSNLCIVTIKDLLTYFPYRYIDNTAFINISELLTSREYSIKYQIRAQVKSFKSAFIRGGRSIQSLKLIDESGEINAMFFNQTYLSNALIEGNKYIFNGKIRLKGKKNIFYPENYDIIKENRESNHLGIITPEYFSTEGLSKKWLRNRIKDLINAINFVEFQSFLSEFDVANSLKTIHFPDNFENLNRSIRNLSLIELINIQLKLLVNKESLKDYKSISLNSNTLTKDLKKILDKIPFKLTLDQKKIIKEIIEQLSLSTPLNSLIEGDVGSGKTILIIIISYLLAKQGYQSVILAPTTILAKQHFETFKKYIDEREVSIDLVIKDTKQDRGNSFSDILIGTSAILSRQSNLIKNLGLIVVDEQHRFGVSQRESLLKPIEVILEGNSINKEKEARSKKTLKNKGVIGKKKVNNMVFPHFINMSATPIPRTLAQLIFQDITIFQLKEKPLGRLPIITYIVPDEKREDSINWVIEKVKNGDQVYWICPLIDISEKVNAQSSEELFENITKDARFKNINIGLLHGRIKEKDKIEILEKFNNKEIDVLISTSVIEVGIDVKNATIILIENAERFGLAQLHQIRGRVGRGDKQSYCLVFFDKDISKDKLNRLKFFSENDDGFELSEFDLNNRGPGEIYGFKQSGVPYLKIATLSDHDLISKSKDFAHQLYSNGVKGIELFE